MKIGNKIKDDLPIDNIDKYYVVADFDKTITTGSSMTSWSILAKSEDVPKEYIEDRQKLYDIYRPIEIDPSLDRETVSKEMYTWFKSHVELFVKYKIPESLFNKAALDKRKMEFRPGAKEFLSYLHENNIPLIIISAGIGNFIEKFLEMNGCYYDNIYISSNIIKFTDGIASGVENNIIHSFNKNEVSLPSEVKEKIKNRENVILLGDQLNDLNMVDETKHNRVIKVGFMTSETEKYKSDFEKAFDILLEENEDYSDVLKTLFKEVNKNE